MVEKHKKAKCVRKAKKSYKNFACFKFVEENETCTISVRESEKKKHTIMHNLDSPNY